ncbi:LysR substrate-binding domain-containing protein [Aestuariirhabdus sp. Z084]|uniref:LysR family transcriptional regulator n=1 Tax=Aestuariirhabdus haliotis TaxID=2918751 RepID=UPI00201B41D1|nr:LysR family transcriptional regulator [Aestuariirhabdus haliotis]MCL6414161.1 LysR substrate-binding domain-containing protein [Aestuariirhabdus haliotis]MCL6418093.1 LysR substrate-binding domain-containing protein [Aestuariirhabdus haliotis]
MNNLHWKGIRSFLAVADHGSFTAAAEVTGLSKANLSQQVSELEQSLGVQLLHRTTRSLRLTDAGEGYRQRCLAAVAQLDDAREWVTGANDALEGEIRMNAVGGVIGEELIAPLLIDFQQQYPSIRIQLDFSSRRVDLMNDPYDLVMRMGELPDSTLIARHLYSLSTCYVASPGFIERHGIIRHPGDLKSLPLIYGSIAQWQFFSEEETFNLDINRGFRIPNGRVMLKAALAGLGVSRLADVYVQAAIEQGKLVEVLPQWRQRTPLSLLCPPARYQLQRVRILMNWLVEHFESRYLSARQTLV